MKWKSSYIPSLLAVGLCVGNASISRAQDRHGVPKFRPRVHISLFNPQGRRVTQQQDQYRYVVPPTRRHGAYYQYEKDYYYTPLVERGEGQPEEAPRPVTMEFGASKHFVELAERIEMMANELCLDLHANYRHNPGFREVYGEAYQFLQTAKFIHDREHQGDREAMRRSATKLDDLFHHVQEEVSGWEGRQNRQVGQLPLQGKTEELQALIHHLLYDLGVKPEHDEVEARDPGAREEAPPPE